MTFTALDARTLVDINSRSQPQVRSNELWNTIKSLANIGATSAIFETIPGGVTIGEIKEAGFQVDVRRTEDGVIDSVTIKW